MAGAVGHQLGARMVVVHMACQDVADRGGVGRLDARADQHRHQLAAGTASSRSMQADRRRGRRRRHDQHLVAGDAQAVAGLQVTRPGQRLSVATRTEPCRAPPAARAIV